MSGSENKSLEWGFLPWLVTTAAIALTVLAVGIVIPRFTHLFPCPMSQQNACINNLRQIDGAKTMWALENGKTNSAVVTEKEIKPYIKLDANGNLPKCPQGGIYTIGKIGEPPTCSLGKVKPGHVLP
jgi:general secretion pathway protein G